MSMSALAGGEVVRHRVVQGENAAACATCGRVLARRGEAEPRWRWQRLRAAVAVEHTRFPAARPPGI